MQTYIVKYSGLEEGGIRTNSGELCSKEFDLSRFSSNVDSLRVEFLFKCRFSSNVVTLRTGFEPATLRLTAACSTN